jgi:hypothetical protein
VKAKVIQAPNVHSLEKALTEFLTQDPAPIVKFITQTSLSENGQTVVILWE